MEVLRGVVDARGVDHGRDITPLGAAVRHVPVHAVVMLVELEETRLVHDEAAVGLDVCLYLDPIHLEIGSQRTAREERQREQHSAERNQRNRHEPGKPGPAMGEHGCLLTSTYASIIPAPRAQRH